MHDGDASGVERRPAPGAVTRLLQVLAEAPEQQADLELTAGTVIGRFELVCELGRGGFGVVWEARDRELGRHVAFKLVRAGRCEAAADQLHHEAEAVARLQHPNLVTLHDIGHCEHGPYLVLELLRGETLQARLRRGPLALAESLSIVAEVARGLAHAHADGVVHRDLKPSNVFLTSRGGVKLLDFGMAHAFGRKRLSGGTPDYMAPEQWREAPEDERTDVFALGVMLYELVSGALPFPDHDGRAVKSPAPAPPLAPDPVPGLSGLVARMLAKDPVDRPRDGGAVLAELQALPPHSGEAGQARPAPARARARTRKARRRMVLATGLALGVLVAALLLRYGGELWPGQPAVRPVMAVADFENQTGDPELNGLSGLLITALEQSRWVQVLPRSRVVDLLRQAGRPQVGLIDEAAAREVSVKEGALVALATVRSFDGLYVFDVKVVDPRRDEHVAAVKEEARGKASVPRTIDRLAERLRRALRESKAEVEASSRILAAAVVNLDAYRHYARAEQLIEEGIDVEGIAEYRKALAIDPGFALAHYGLSSAFEYYGTPEQSRAEMEAALAGAARLPRKEQLLFRAWKAHLDGQHAESRRLYAAATAEFPQDKQVLGAAATHHYHEPDCGLAIPILEKLAALSPPDAAGTLSVCLALAGRAEDGLRLLGETVGTPSRYDDLLMGQGLIWAGRTAEGLARLQRAGDTLGAQEDLGFLVSGALLYLQAGQLRQGEVMARRAEAAAQRSPAGSPHHYGPLVATALTYQGRRREGAGQLGRDPGRGLQRALFWAGAGDREATRRAVDELLADVERRKAQTFIRDRNALAKAPILLEYLGDSARAAEVAAMASDLPARRLYQALAAWRTRRELAPLRAMAAEPWHTAVPFFLGEVLLEAGDLPGAVTALRRFQAGPRAGLFGWLPDRPDLFDAWAYPKSHLLLARALERQGDLAGARQSVQALLAIWSEADADLPQLLEARALAARLATRR